jgi:hypothetical protein
MVHRRRVIALAAAVAIVCSAGLFAQKKDDKKRDDAQTKDVAAIEKLVDEVAGGTAQPPNDLGLLWARDDAFKALGNKEFVPFIVTVDPSKVAGGNVNFYWRVVSKNAPSPTPAPAGKNDKNKKAVSEYPWEDVNLNVPVVTGAKSTASSAPAPTRIARSFTVAPGVYDVYVACQEPGSPQKGAAPVQKVAVIKRTVTVPDFWNGEFNTSTPVISQRYDPIPAPLTPQQLVDRPYASFGLQKELVPTLDNKLAKKDDLGVFFLIYNPKTDAANKPAVTVEYNFYAKSAGGEKFFNKTALMELNAATLPPQFDFAAGHQLVGGQDIPMASFPEGDYRLEIKVTDTIASKTLTRDVNFTVTAS